MKRLELACGTLHEHFGCWFFSTAVRFQAATTLICCSSPHPYYELPAIIQNNIFNIKASAKQHAVNPLTSARWPRAAVTDSLSICTIFHLACSSRLNRRDDCHRLCVAKSIFMQRGLGNNIIFLASLKVIYAKWLTFSGAKKSRSGSKMCPILCFPQSSEAD